MLDEAQVEHDSAKLLIADLMDARSGDRFRDAKISVLREQIKHHVGEEDMPGAGIMAQARAHGVDFGRPRAATQGKEADPAGARCRVETDTRHLAQSRPRHFHPPGGTYG